MAADGNFVELEECFAFFRHRVSFSRRRRGFLLLSLISGKGGGIEEATGATTYRTSVKIV